MECQRFQIDHSRPFEVVIRHHRSAMRSNRPSFPDVYGSVAIFMTANITIVYQCSIHYILINIRCHLFCHPLATIRFVVVVVEKAHVIIGCIRTHFSIENLNLFMVIGTVDLDQPNANNFFESILQFSCILLCLKVKNPYKGYEMSFLCQKQKCSFDHI